MNAVKTQLVLHHHGRQESAAEIAGRLRIPVTAVERIIETFAAAEHVKTISTEAQKKSGAKGGADTWRYTFGLGGGND